MKRRNDGIIDFGFTYKDQNIMRWIMRVEDEIDDYIELNGTCSVNLAMKLSSILEDLMTNFNASSLLEQLELYLSIKLEKPRKDITLDDLMMLVKYMRARMMNKVQERPELIKFQQLVIPERVGVQ